MKVHDLLFFQLLCLFVFTLYAHTLEMGSGTLVLGTRLGYTRGANLVGMSSISYDGHTLLVQLKKNMPIHSQYSVYTAH
jgi:hypothetical protein